MLMLIEHDSILSTPEARRSLAAFVAHRPNINVAVFHSASCRPPKSATPTRPSCASA